MVSPKINTTNSNAKIYVNDLDSSKRLKADSRRGAMAQRKHNYVSISLRYLITNCNGFLLS